MTSRLIIFFIGCFLILWIVAYYDHKKIEYAIERNLVIDDSLLFRDIFDSGDKICILPPYKDPSSIESLVSIEDFEYLNSDLNRFMYGWEDLWVVVKIEQHKHPQIFGVSGLTRPDFKQSQCMDFRKAKISLSSKEKSYMYFIFSEE